MSGGGGGSGSISVCNNKLYSIGPEWSKYEVGTPPSHNSDKPHIVVASINNNNNCKIWEQHSASYKTCLQLKNDFNQAHRYYR